MDIQKALKTVLGAESVPGWCEIDCVFVCQIGHQGHTTGTVATPLLLDPESQVSHTTPLTYYTQYVVLQY